MECLIKVDNKILYFFLLLLTCSCSSQNKIVPKDNLSYNIIFGDFFSEDKVTLLIDGKTVFQNAVLNSYGSMGITKVWVKITTENGENFVSSSEGKEKSKIEINPKSIILTVILNDKSQRITIKKSKGKFILFHKAKNGEVAYDQTIKEPIFD